MKRCTGASYTDEERDGKSRLSGIWYDGHKKSPVEFTMVTFVLVIVSLGLFGAFVYQLSKNVVFGWYCLLSVNLINVALGLNQMMIGVLHLDPVDIINISLLAAGTIRFLYRVQLP